jgi:pimeloyl-ACP methyl ester carboxylesterase
MTALNVLEQTGRGRSVLVMLPGAHMPAHEFVQAGFMQKLKDHDLPLDLMVVDIDLTQTDPVDARSQVLEQVLMPVRAKYERLFVGGISLGGQAAVLHAAQGAVHIDGLCLLAPYPGSRLTMNAIDRAGGLDSWQPTTLQLSDPDCQVWQWLKMRSRLTSLFMGYGREDRFFDGMQRQAAQLSLEAIHVIPGAHDWPTWKTLWSLFLNRGAFVR